MILVADEKIEFVEQLLPTLELAARESRPLMVVASDVVDQALAALIMNSVRGSMKVCAVKAPRYGEERRNIMKDLCTSIGATFITRADGLQLKDVKLSHFGNCKSITISKSWTTVVGGKGEQDEIDKKIEALKKEIEQTDAIKECQRIQERITRLVSGVAVIRVGAATEVEMIEKKHRIDDALEAVRSAQEEGIVAGGGAALIHSCTPLYQAIQTPNDEEYSDFTDDEMLGAKIVLKACESPLRQMSANADKSPDIIVETVKGATGKDWGYNFVTDKVCCLTDDGVIDPVKVTRVALENAVSVGSTLITTGHAIVTD